MISETYSWFILLDSYGHLAEYFFYDKLIEWLNNWLISSVASNFMAYENFSLLLFLVLSYFQLPHNLWQKVKTYYNWCIYCSIVLRNFDANIILKAKSKINRVDIELIKRCNRPKYVSCSKPVFKASWSFQLKRRMWWNKKVIWYQNIIQFQVEITI